MSRKAKGEMVCVGKDNCPQKIGVAIFPAYGRLCHPSRRRNKAYGKGTGLKKIQIKLQGNRGLEIGVVIVNIIAKNDTGVGSEGPGESETGCAVPVISALKINSGP